MSFLRADKKKVTIKEIKEYSRPFKITMGKMHKLVKIKGRKIK